MDKEELLPPIHPGEILLEEFLEPLQIELEQIAQDIKIPANQVQEVVDGIRAISPNMALRLSHYFGLSERFWINLQSRYDLEVEKDKLQGRLEQEVTVFAIAA